MVLSTPLHRALQQSIAASPTGLSLAEVAQRHPEIPRRTAQRLLAQGVRDGALRAIGQARARRYVSNAYPAAPEGRPLMVREATPTLPAGIRLSSDSQDILAYIGQAPGLRRPLGYQSDFLDAYVPNE